MADVPDNDAPDPYDAAADIRSKQAASLVDMAEPGALDVLVFDMMTKAAAGNGLVYAIYHATLNDVLALPPAVTAAYQRACRAYHVGQEHRVVRRGD